MSEPFFRYLPADMAAVAAGMVWGQRQLLDADQFGAFRSTGLLHLLVLSGQNITLLVGFFQNLDKWLGYRLKIGLTMAVALFYLAVFSSEPPIVRASLMAVLNGLVILKERATPPLYIFFLTALVMLVFRSEWIGSLSFWLSMAATFGIYTLYRPLLKKLKIEALALSVSAQVFTTPLLLLTFREFPLLALPMNVLVTVLVEPIMFFGVLLSLAYHLCPFLTIPLSFILFGILKLLLFLVELGHSLGSLLMIGI